MTVLEEFTAYLDKKTAEIIKDFPALKALTLRLTDKIKDFTEEDFEGVNENKVYRIFLDTVREIVNISIEENATKSYMRSFFKALDSKEVHKALTPFMQSKAEKVKSITDRMVNFYVYQDPTSSEEYRKSEIMRYLDNMM